MHCICVLYLYVYLLASIHIVGTVWGRETCLCIQCMACIQYIAFVRCICTLYLYVVFVRCVGTLYLYVVFVCMYCILYLYVYCVYCIYCVCTHVSRSFDSVCVCVCVCGCMSASLDAKLIQSYMCVYTCARVPMFVNMRLRTGVCVCACVYIRPFGYIY